MFSEFTGRTQLLISNLTSLSDKRGGGQHQDGGHLTGYRHKNSGIGKFDNLQWNILIKPENIGKEIII